MANFFERGETIITISQAEENHGTTCYDLNPDYPGLQHKLIRPAQLILVL
jgi:hypothetical protein